MDEIELPPEGQDTFFDKDHIVFYLNEQGEIKCLYSLFNKEIFQDLILAILSGAVSDSTVDYLIEDLNNIGDKENALAMIVVKKLMISDDDHPIVKPSNFS